MNLKISKHTAQQIVETVKDVCGHDINYIDLNGIIYASTNKARIGKFHEIGKQVALTGETIEVADNNSFFGTQAGVNIPIMHKGELISIIGISGIPDEVRKYAYLAQRITILLLREQELDIQTNTRKTQSNYIIRSLISEKQAHTRPVTDYIQEHHIEETTPYQLLLISLDSRYNPNNLGMIEATILQRFQFAGSDLYTFNYPHAYILILEATRFRKYRYIFEDLAATQSRLLQIAVSAQHPIYRQYLSYAEAQLALSSPCKMPLHDYQALGVEILCADLAPAAAALYRDKFLSRLTKEDCDLLNAYYQNDMSLVRTGDQLFLHKNTVQYRLDRIQKKSGFNPRAFKDASGFYTALILARHPAG